MLSLFLFYQGDRGDSYSFEIKGDQGIPGLPGLQVGDVNWIAKCLYTCIHRSYLSADFHAQGFPGSPGFEGPTGPEVHLSYDSTFSHVITFRRCSG